MSADLAATTTTTMSVDIDQLRADVLAYRKKVYAGLIKDDSITPDDHEPDLASVDTWQPSCDPGFYMTRSAASDLYERNLREIHYAMRVQDDWTLNKEYRETEERLNGSSVSTVTRSYAPERKLTGDKEFDYLFDTADEAAAREARAKRPQIDMKELMSFLPTPRRFGKTHTPAQFVLGMILAEPGTRTVVFTNAKQVAPKKTRKASQRARRAAQRAHKC